MSLDDDKAQLAPLRGDVPDPVESALRARPDHTALLSDGRAWTAGELADAIARCAGGLLDAGVKAGERVALSGPPSADFVIALHALGRVGAVACPISPSGPRVAWRRELAATSAHSCWSVGADLSKELSAPAHLSTLRPRPSWAAPARPWRLEDERLVILSSGSSGAPRPTALSSGQLLFSAMGSALRLGHAQQDRWLCCLPLHHIGGLSVLLRCAIYGTTLDLRPRFEAVEVATALDSGEVSLVSLVPEMLARVLDARPAERLPGALRAALIGGAPTPPELLRRCREIDAPLSLTWGMSEAASQVATRFPGDLRQAPDCGPPLPFTRVTSEQGRLEVHGPIAAGRLRSADHGALDEQGRVQVTGRADAVLNSGGVKVSPQEIEAVLCAHPAVSEAAVGQRQDPRWGARPVAVLVAAGGRALDDGALRDWCRERLSKVKTPELFLWEATLPRSALGKLRRGMVQELIERRAEHD